MSIEAMNPERAAYFMRRFKHDEKMLGPNEQAALNFVIVMLEQAQKQEPVAWRVAEVWSSSNPDEKVVWLARDEADQERVQKHYSFIRWLTSPPQRQPMTLQEIQDAKKQVDPGNEDLCGWSFTEGIRWVERKNGITGEQK